VLSVCASDLHASCEFSCSMEGWLKKKGENLGALFWKDRWFKEEDGKLLYFTSASADTPKGFIDLRQVKDVRVRSCSTPSQGKLCVTPR